MHLAKIITQELISTFLNMVMLNIVHHLSIIMEIITEEIMKF